MERVFMWFFVIIISLIAAWIERAYNKKRQDEFWAYARRRKWKFSASDRWGLPHRFEKGHIFSQGDSRNASNVLYSEYEEEDGRILFKVFDYRFSTGSGKNRTTHYYTICAFEFPCKFPSIYIRPEGFFDKIGSFMGFDDINFESHEFSKKFHVSSKDRQFAFEAIHPRIMEVLLDQCSDKVVEIGPFYMLLYRYSAGRTDLLTIASLVRIGKQLYDLIPQYTKKKYLVEEGKLPRHHRKKVLAKLANKLRRKKKKKLTNPLGVITDQILPGKK